MIIGLTSNATYKHKKTVACCAVHFITVRCYNTLPRSAAHTYGLVVFHGRALELFARNS